MDELIHFGTECKALDDAGRVGGLLVVFGGADLVGDRFTKETDFDLEPGEKRSIYYSHGFDPVLKRRKLGRAELTVKDEGVWMEGQLNLRDAYERKIFEMIKAGKQGLSSGSAPHLVERKKVGDAHEILTWPIIEASITPTPAEPRTSVLSLKSYHEFLVGDGSLDGLRFSDELAAVLTAAESGVKRAQGIRDACTKEGRALSASRRERIAGMHQSLQSLVSELQSLLEETEPKPELADLTSVVGEIARYERARTAL